jgi:Rod binding domain-containing protein
MNALTTTPLLARSVLSQSVPNAARTADDPAKIHDAAEQFESLLMAQILRAARENAGGLSGSDAGSSGSAATEFAEQQFAMALSQRGGLGLSSLISKGLQK